MKTMRRRRVDALELTFNRRTKSKGEREYDDDGEDEVNIKGHCSRVAWCWSWRSSKLLSRTGGDGGGGREETSGGLRPCEVQLL